MPRAKTSSKTPTKAPTRTRARHLSPLRISPLQTPAMRASGSDLRTGTTALRALIFTFVLLACHGRAAAEEIPLTPCDSERPFPAYAQAGKAPNVHVWSEGQPGKQWMPPACIGWMPKDGTLVAVAGQFAYQGTVDGLLARFGAISTLKGLQYWSVTDNRRETLITDATALDGPDLARPRPDFTPAELRDRSDFYFAEADNRSSQPVVYRMHVMEAATMVVVTVENVTPLRLFMLTMFGPGDMQSVHFLTRTGPGLWSYYGLGRTGVAVGSLIGVQDASYANRALALYAHISGLPVEPVQP